MLYFNTFFSVEVVDAAQIEYDNPNLESFHKYLNNKITHFPIQNISYSKALYDYDYTSYRLEYDKYLFEQGFEEEETKIKPSFAYDLYSFWITERFEILDSFCKAHKLYYDRVLNALDLYLAENIPIQNSNILEFTIVKPPIEERDNVIKDLQAQLKILIEQLKDQK